MRRRRADRYGGYRERHSRSSVQVCPPNAVHASASSQNLVAIAPPAIERPSMRRPAARLPWSTSSSAPPAPQPVRRLITPTARPETLCSGRFSIVGRVPRRFEWRWLASRLRAAWPHGFAAHTTTPVASLDAGLYSPSCAQAFELARLAGRRQHPRAVGARAAAAGGSSRSSRCAARSRWATEAEWRRRRSWEHPCS